MINEQRQYDRLHEEGHFFYARGDSSTEGETRLRRGYMSTEGRDSSTEGKTRLRRGRPI
jgi:hypothetical protein